MVTRSMLNRIKRLRRAGLCGGLARLCFLLRSRVAQCFKLERCPFLPHRIDVEPIDACNFTCDHCQVTHWNRLTTRLTPERLGTILTQFPRRVSIKLQGMGEPFLNRHLLDMLEECERRGIDVEVTSNGSVYTENIASRVSSLRGALVVFSIDGATAATFEAIRTKGNFRKVTGHVADLVRRRGGKRWPRIEIRTVATLRNAHELPDVVRLAKKIGVDSLVITTLLSDWGKQEMRESIAPIHVARKHFWADQLLREAERVAEAIRMPIVVERGQRYSYSRFNRCIWPWQSAYIAASGDVVPCCVVADSSVVKMGNVFDEAFPEIWNNEKYRELRRRIASDDVPHYCRSCYGMTPVAAAEMNRVEAAEPTDRGMQEMVGDKGVRTRLDLVLPAFNEEKGLANAVGTLSEFMSARMDDYDWRIVIVDNGSTDSTSDVGRRVAGGNSRVHYLRVEQKGKGGGVRHAWARSDAEIMAYMDVDLATDLRCLPALIHVIPGDGYDVAIGSRLKQGSQIVGRTLRREFMSRCYSTLFRAMFRTGFVDAQCGFKAVNRGVVEHVLPLVKDTGWFFDTELLILCERRGYSICELPVEWVDRPDSRVRITSTVYQVAKGLLRLRLGITAGGPKEYNKRR